MKKHISFGVPESSSENHETLTTQLSGPVCQLSQQKSIRPKMGVNRNLNPVTRRKYRDFVLDPKLVDNKLVDYVVANYHLESVSRGLTLRKAEYQSLFATIWHPSTFSHAIFGITWKPLLLFLFLYYTLQLLYHLHVLQLFCEQDENSEDTATESDNCGDALYSAFVADYKEQEKTAARYLTFILGFYVSNIIKRWWDQVKLVPEIDSITNYMAGLIQRSGDSYDSGAALFFKKKLIRYCLLSWTMCFTSISKPFNDKMKDARDFFDKGLLTEEELVLLQVPGGSDDGWKDNWVIPMTWAISLVNAHESHKGFKIKDQKDLIGALNRYQQRLEDASSYQGNPLPFIYGQAVLVTVYVVFLLGAVAVQELHKASITWALIVNFPMFQCVKVILMFGWMTLANILRNPFHTDKHYNLDLNQKLDINIWKASVAIQNMHNIPN